MDQGNLGQCKLPTHLKVDASDPEWVSISQEVVHDPESAAKVEVLDLNVGSSELAVVDEDIAFLLKSMSCSEVPVGLADKDGKAELESMIMFFFLSKLPRLVEVHLHLSGGYENLYFKSFGPATLPTLRVISMEYLWVGRSIGLDVVSRLLDATPNIQKMETKGCDDKSSRFQTKAVHPSLTELRLVNISQYKKQLEFFVHCPKIHSLEFVFAFDFEPFIDGLLASPGDLVEAIQLQAPHLEMLYLAVGRGTLPRERGKIDSLANFSALKKVSIAAEFIQDASHFIKSLPPSVASLTVVGDVNGICKALKDCSLRHSMVIEHTGCTSGGCNGVADITGCQMSE